MNLSPSPLIRHPSNFFLSLFLSQSSKETPQQLLDLKQSNQSTRTEVIAIISTVRPPTFIFIPRHQPRAQSRQFTVHPLPKLSPLSLDRLKKHTVISAVRTNRTETPEQHSLQAPQLSVR